MQRREQFQQLIRPEPVGRVDRPLPGDLLVDEGLVEQQAPGPQRFRDPARDGPLQGKKLTQITSNVFEAGGDSLTSRMDVRISSFSAMARRRSPSIAVFEIS